ncbi:MAG: hypothetical protein J2P37_25660 [Ktedonobacteraceae bacterium]|nr:hypothetical protein [Ktedonobacteraceae bacterium]
MTTTPSRFQCYPLPRLYPEGDVLVLNREQQVLSRLSQGRIIEQQVFTFSEMALIAEVLESYPDYCPFEVLLSTYTHRPLDQCREQVNRALDEGEIDGVIRPVRNLLSRCRAKLYPFGLNVAALLETGYQLVPLSAVRPYQIRKAGKEEAQR